MLSAASLSLDEDTCRWHLYIMTAANPGLTSSSSMHSLLWPRIKAVADDILVGASRPERPKSGVVHSQACALNRDGACHNAILLTAMRMQFVASNLPNANREKGFGTRARIT